MSRPDGNAPRQPRWGRSKSAATDELSRCARETEESEIRSLEQRCAQKEAELKESYEKNQALLHEASRLQDIEGKLEEQMNTAKELQLLIDIYHSGEEAGRA